jgi:hypothetical protein
MQEPTALFEGHLNFIFVILEQRIFSFALWILVVPFFFFSLIRYLHLHRPPSICPSPFLVTSNFDRFDLTEIGLCRYDSIHDLGELIWCPEIEKDVR